MTEQQANKPDAKTPAEKPPTYVAVEDITWCGRVYKSGEAVPVGNKGTARDLIARKQIKEK